MSFKYKGSKVLLTEGINDCHVISALCKHYKIPETFGLYECGSDELALKRLTALLATPEQIETIGIVIDADNPALIAKWQAVKDRLQKSGITAIQDAPGLTGTIIPSTNGLPKVGVWLMPNNQIDGMLEDFCSQLAHPIGVGFAEKCVNEAKANDVTTFIDAHKTKAVIHTFLAWQHEPGMPLGQAITTRTLNPDNALAKIFADWLTQLFQ
ncbi:MAG: hypothetical protein HOP34_14765 [Methylococcaceae bacterium]|nr:hypothetical protein [Methylococcaceae bacterium]